MQTKEQLKEILVEQYLNRFFTFYVSRTSSIEDAEDLSQKAACECLDAIDRVDNINNVNGYFWSIAHNVYKNYLNRRSNYILDDDYCKMQIVDTSDSEYESERRKRHNELRKSLSILSGLYQKILVYYYYQELKIKQIADILDISQDMVKFYLSNGKKKLKELYYMNQEYGEKSFNPSDFSIYYSGIDFASVNVWELFRRKLPGQIALVCYKKARTLSEIAMEVGCSSCYVEEEVELLVNAGVLLQQTKGKYQTNFYIISKEELQVIDEMYKNMYQEYINDVNTIFNENLEEIKNKKIYKHEATIEQYKWIFADMIADMDRRNLFTKDADYPKILSCGARGLVFALESKTPKGVCGQSPSYLNDYTLWARDLSEIKGICTNQPILRDKNIAQTVIDVYNGIIDDNKKDLYAYLIKNGILIKINEELKCNIAYVSKELKKLMKEINENLYKVLEPHTNRIKTYLTKIVNKSIPNSLKDYVNGYVITLMEFFAGNKIIEELISCGFLSVENKNIQMSYFIDK